MKIFLNNNGYTFINLLPYREKIKKEKIKQFSFLMGLFTLLTIFIIFIIYSSLSLEIEQQKLRNNYIAQQNKKLDQNIKEIVTLKEEIKETLEKRKVVEDLQINRSDMVSILNSISQQLPEGVTLKKVTQLDKKVTLTGFTLSNNKVSNYMTNLAKTDIFVNPELVEIKAIQISSKKQNAKVKDDQNMNEFIINVYLKTKPEVFEDNKRIK